MSEIRDKTRNEILEMLKEWGASPLAHPLPKVTEQILAIDSLAVVDRDAPSPENPFEGYIDVTENIRMAKSQGFQRCLEDMAGYVLEV